VTQEGSLPDDHRALSHVSLRVPSDLIDTFDKLAAVLERPRSWVMLRALRQYLDEGEGAEIAEDTESLAELDRGETISSDDLRRRLEEIIARAARAHAQKKCPPESTIRGAQLRKSRRFWLFLQSIANGRLRGFQKLSDAASNNSPNSRTRVRRVSVRACAG
jgi:predicted transcriptional regulator